MARRLPPTATRPRSRRASAARAVLAAGFFAASLLAAGFFVAGFFAAAPAIAQETNCAFPGRACAMHLSPFCAQLLGRADLDKRRPVCVPERERYHACLAQTRAVCGEDAVAGETIAVSCETYDFISHRALKFRGGIRLLPDNVYHLPVFKIWGVYDRDEQSYFLTYQDARYRLDRESGELRMFVSARDEAGQKIGLCRLRGQGDSRPRF